MKVIKGHDAPLDCVNNKDTYVYWDICGLQAPIRLALALANADYVEVRLDPGDPNTPDYKGAWFAKKPALSKKGCPFPNLPYAMMTDGSYLVQSNAILRAIGYKYNLIAHNISLMDQALDQATDLDATITGACYRDFSSLKLYFIQKLPQQLHDWAKFLGDKPFMAGDSVSIADCKVYEIFRKLQIIANEHALPDLFAATPQLATYIQRFESIPAISKYQASDTYMSRPLNNPHAQFR
eukprot:CAMPEP_0197323034 /NCGR_PEP_ID=MMETSP0891-20130614/70271_1 /TAXON_ID=44058 ORGANISM="Aureoumbra lagunensis, Strain CCMP1510" /NCGR_SAMPLE_ID=MMETSP0891 /ASSEMBLY_ACC=CAM_ASM_000534 /LENGTH=237 /DNA_ID=CAMNT_0042815581 /DNA_START=350 /DNA_END=1063 /DNA_ORIENTATION=-